MLDERGFNYDTDTPEDYFEEEKASEEDCIHFMNAVVMQNEEAGRVSEAEELHPDFECFMRGFMDIQSTGSISEDRKNEFNELVQKHTSVHPEVEERESLFE